MEDALVYAGLQFGGGDLYEVELVGELEPDGDYKGNYGYSVQTVAARVVRVVRSGIFGAPPRCACRRKRRLEEDA